MALKLTDVRANPYTRAKISSMSNPLFSESDWRKSIENGTINSYIALMQDSKNINPDDFYKKYDLYYGDMENRLTALYNETYVDRNTVKDYQKPLFDEAGNYVYDEQGNQLYENVKMTEYDYNKNMIFQANEVYRKRKEYEQEVYVRENRNDFFMFLADAGVISMQALNSLLAGVENISSFLGSSLEELGETGGQLITSPFKGDKSFSEHIKGGESYAETTNKWYTDYQLNDALQGAINEFAYNQSHFYDAAGNQSQIGEYILGTVDTLAKMVPTLVLAYYTAGTGNAISASASLGSKAATIGANLTSAAGTIGQLTYYAANVYGQSISDQYEYYASQGITVSSSEIVANSLVKTILQLGVEKGLGAFLGSTGIDNLFWGTSPKTNILRFSNKNFNAKFFGTLAKDVLQEGIEESLQETSDWFVDYCHHFINEDFQSTEWNWQNIWDAFAIACLTSIIGTSGRISMQTINRRVKNKKAKTGKWQANTEILKQDKEGNLVKNSDGEYEYVMLNPIAAYQYGLDLQSAIENFEELQKSYDKLIDLKRGGETKLNKAQSQYVAAYYQAVGSFEIIANLYGEMGKERFAKANEILIKMQQATDDNKLDVETIQKAQKALVNKIWVENENFEGFISGIQSLHYEYNQRAMEKIVEAKITEWKTSISSDDEEIDDELNKAAHSVMDLDKTIKKVIVTDGTRPVRLSNVLLIPENLLKNDPNGKIILQTDAELKLAETLRDEILGLKSIPGANLSLELITDLYKQWTKDDDVTEEEAIFNLMFDVNFFNCLLCLNEKETTTFILRLRDKINNFKFKDTTKDRLFVKQINNMKERWTLAATDYYINNIDANVDEYARFLKGDEKEKFLQTVNKNRYLFKTGSKIIENPKSLSDVEHSFILKRINNAPTNRTERDNLLKLFESSNPVDRSNFVYKLNMLYDGAFQSLYNGKYYMPTSSVANMVFNNFLKIHNLNIQTFLDSNAITPAEQEAMSGKDLFEYRLEQFSVLCNNRYKFVLNKNGDITIKGDDKAVGWSAVNTILSNNTTYAHIISGKNVEFETSKRSEKTRRFATNIKSTSKLFRSMLNPSVHEQGIATWVSIDDVVNNPLYLTEEIQEEIQEEYGDLSSDNVFVYLQKEINKVSEGKQGLVMLRDGSVAIQDMSKLTEMFQSEIKFPPKGTYSLDNFISDKIRNQYTKNVKVVFGAKHNRYIDWEPQSINGKRVLVFVNRIELKSTDVNEMMFALAHEIEHVLQFQMSMNAGISSDVLGLFNSNTQDKIIKNVKKLSPELFVGNPDPIQTKKIVNRYLYFGTGELQAMGLSSTKEMAFYPIRSRRNSDGKVTITLPDGSSYFSYGRVNNEFSKNKIFTKIKNSFPKQFKNLTYKVDTTNAENRFKKASSEFQKLLNNKDLRAIDNYINILYDGLGYDMSRNDFDNVELPVVNIDGRWYFTNNLNGYQKILEANKFFAYTVNVKYAKVKISNIKDLSFISMNNSEISFEIKNGKFTNSKSEKINLVDFATNEQSLIEPTDNYNASLRLNEEKLIYEIAKDYSQSEKSLFDAFIKVTNKPKRTVYSTYISSIDNYQNDLFKVLDEFDDKLQPYLYEYLGRPDGTKTSEELKTQMMNVINENNITVKSIIKFRNYLGMNNMPIEEFLELEIPILRHQVPTIVDEYYFERTDSGEEISNKDLLLDNSLSKSTFVSAYPLFGDGIPVATFANSEFLIRYQPISFVSKIKIKDIILFIPTFYGEILVKPEVFLNGRSIVNGEITKVEQSNYEYLERFNIDYKRLYELKSKVLSFYKGKTNYKLAESVFKTAERIMESYFRHGIQPTFFVGSELSSTLGATILGAHESDSKIVSFHSDYYEPETILHEMIHFCLMNTQLSNLNIKTDFRIPDIAFNKSAELIEKLWEKVKSETDPKLFYGLTNSREFAAELSNEDFVTFLMTKDLGDELNKIFESLFGFKASNVFHALRTATMDILDTAQYLTDDIDESFLDDIKQYNMYNGPLYDGNVLIKENAMNYSVANLSSKAIEGINKIVSLKQNEDESDADYIRRLLSDEKSKNIIMKLFKNLDNEINTIYVDGEFPLYDGEISNYSVSPIKSETTKNIETEIENQTISESIEAKSDEKEEVSTEIKKEPKPPKRYKKRKYTVVDKREILKVELDKSLHTHKITAEPKNTNERVYDVDFNESEPDRKPGNVHAKYFYRKFLYRAYYTKADGSTGWRDIYEMWYEKDQSDKRWFTKDEVSETNLKYFSKGKEQFQMNPSLAQFIIYSTNHKLPNELQNKISGDEAGTLTYNDVLIYLFNATDEEADIIFNTVNKFFYQNDNIKSIQELRKIKELLPKIQALYLVLRKTEYKDYIFDELSIDEIERIWNNFSKISDEMSKLLSDYVESFDKKINQEKYKASESYSTLDISDEYSLHKIMLNYSGRIVDGAFIGKDIRIDAWKWEDVNIGNRFRGSDDALAHADSLDASVGTDKEGRDSSRSRSEVIGDEDLGSEDEQGYYQLIEIVENTKRAKIIKQLSNPLNKFGNNIAVTIATEAKRLKLTDLEAREAYNSFIRFINGEGEISDSQLEKLYIGSQIGFTEDDLDNIYFMANIAEDIEVDEERHQRYLEIEKRLTEVTRDERNLQQGIERQANGTIASYVSKQNRSRFLKENGDLFEVYGNSVRLKTTILYENVEGQYRLRSAEELRDIKNRMNEISRDLRIVKAYESDAALKLSKENKKLREKNYEKIKSKSSDNIYRIALGNGNTLDVDGVENIPPSLKKLIEFGKAKEATTQVQRFSKTEEVTSDEGEIKTAYTETHAKLVYDNFIENAAEILAEIGQEGADEIVDFYLSDSVKIIAGNEDRIAMNIQQLLIGYLFSKHYNNDLHFSDERLDKITKYLTMQASIAGTWLSNQKTILTMLKRIDSGAVVDQALLDYVGIPMDDEDRANLNRLLNTMRKPSSNKTEAKRKYDEARENFQTTLLKKYKGNKKTFLSKFLVWERAMMLSSPSTWIRNLVSNVIVTGGNIGSAKVGEDVTKLLNKLFPKSKWFKERENQYKIVGTKTSKKTKDFIDEAFVNSGFMDEVLGGLNKYDPRRISKFTSGDNLTDMVALKISNNIKQTVLFDGDNKVTDSLNWVIGKIFRMTSDDPFIKRKLKSYLGKIIEEELAKNPKLKLELTSNSIYGISNDMLDLFVKAYELAAFDYMHSSNWVMDMERQLSIRLGEKGYFVYKQLFPFLGAAWNWSVEGMRYTPLGFVKSIINFAKLENTMYKMDKARQEGKPVISSEFAQYIARRNIGKGIIGIIGWTIGMILASLGLAGIDEEDDEYKLILGNVKVDISDVLGSQGIILGIATTTELMKKEKDPLKVWSQILNQFFDESVFQTVIDGFRYKKGVGDVITELAFYDIPSMLWPNILKTMASITHHQGVVYSDGLKGELERFAAKNIPFSQLVAQNIQVDPYTGKSIPFFSGNLFQTIGNKVLPIDVEVLDISNNEFEAISRGVKANNLTGKYTIDGVSLKLTADEKIKLNEFYGKLNQISLSNLYSGEKYVQLEDGTYDYVKYSSMTDKQKKAAIESALSSNSHYSKIYILTSTGKYKYYASDSEYEELRKLGITKNIYRKVGNKTGFVKI